MERIPVAQPSHLPPIVVLIQLELQDILPIGVLEGVWAFGTVADNISFPIGKIFLQGFQDGSGKLIFLSPLHTPV